MDERRTFVALMRRYGRPAPSARRLDPQPRLTPDETDCWTHAYGYATAHPGSEYWEGVCYTDDPDRGVVAHAHAWVVERSPLGGFVLVELTDGYQQARNYRGLPVDLSTPAAARAQDGRLRYSVLELTIAIQQGAEA